MNNAEARLRHTAEDRTEHIKAWVERDDLRVVLDELDRLSSELEAEKARVHRLADLGNKVTNLFALATRERGRWRALFFRMRARTSAGFWGKFASMQSKKRREAEHECETLKLQIEIKQTEIATLKGELARVRAELGAEKAEAEVARLRGVVEGKNGQWSREWHKRVEQEARAEKAELNVEYLRSAHDFTLVADERNNDEDFYMRSEVDAHLASSPPKGWKP